MENAPRNETNPHTYSKQQRLDQPPRWSSATVRVVLLIALIYPLISLAPADASGSYPSVMAQRGTHRDCADLATPGCQTRGWIDQGTDVKMHCYVDESWATGRYRSNRWFYVTARATGTRGYVHSSNVDRQETVPYCGEHPGIRAATWAAEHLGETRTSLTPDGMWSGWCQTFAQSAHLQTGSRPLSGYPSARATYDEYRRRGLVQTDLRPQKIHIGAIVYYPSLTQWGHAAVYLGNGYVASTQGVGDSTLPITRVPLDHFGAPGGWIRPDQVGG